MRYLRKRKLSLSWKDYYKTPMYKQLHPFCIFDEEQEVYFCGFIDSNGNVVIPPKYEVAEDFSEGLALVAEYGWGSAYGFINTCGEVVIPPFSMVANM